jgi:hypothetical protein
MDDPQFEMSSLLAAHSSASVHSSPSILCIKKLCPGLPGFTKSMVGSSTETTPTIFARTRAASIPPSADPSRGKEFTSPWHVPPMEAQFFWKKGATLSLNETGEVRLASETYGSQLGGPGAVALEEHAAIARREAHAVP